MKAVILNQHGSSDVLQYVKDYPVPEIKNNEVLLKVGATSLNRIDTVVRRGYPGLTIPMPHILGGDMAGTVEKLGKNVEGFLKGDRVAVYPVALPDYRDPRYGEMEHLNDGWQFFGMQRQGAYCEYVAVPAENLFKIADSISFETAASLPIAGLTAYHAVNSVTEIKPDDYFFIWGGGGGLASFAIQLAKLKGATVIATVGNDDKIKKVKEFGADYVFNHHSQDIPALVKEITPSGVNVVVDYVGPATFDRSFSMLRKNGTIIFCGIITGLETKLSIHQTYFRHLNLRGIYLGSKPEFAAFLKLIGEGQIKSNIHKVFDLRDAAEAHNLLESGNYTGKIVLKV
ncbi:MAG: zinc-binding dehydrogenase [Candidatus Kapabacteria bacterium]|nr:zinc-binding dehydrogenase [Ignavibacteriota bacterium]MCW5883492.1 zinc-binding dehydrogenase [Candidatus Kapabacteria bacterium]